MTHPWSGVFGDVEQSELEAEPETVTEEIAAKPSLDLPVPDGPPSVPPRSIATEPDQPAPFSTEVLLQRFEASPSGRPRRPGGAILAEYGGVIGTLALGTLAVFLAMRYGSCAPREQAAEPAAPSPSQRSSDSRSKTSQAGIPSNGGGSDDALEKDEQPEAGPRVPVLSVVSSPPGALVEVDGTIYGRTPLILPSPRAERFEVRLRLDEHRPFRTVVGPNDAGHFSVNATLEPIRPD
ncbi:MAG: PEGA domain-containing protein [Myxococcota bacterium]